MKKHFILTSLSIMMVTLCACTTNESKANAERTGDYLLEIPEQLVGIYYNINTENTVRERLIYCYPYDSPVENYKPYDFVEIKSNEIKYYINKISYQALCDIVISDVVYKELQYNSGFKFYTSSDEIVIRDNKVLKFNILNSEFTFENSTYAKE